MVKRLLIPLFLILLGVALLAGCNCQQEPPTGQVAEVPSPTTSPLPAPTPSTPSEPTAPTQPTPSTPSLPSPVIAAPSTLTVLSITEGNVLILKADSDNWINAQVGMTLEVGDTVKSDDDSNAEITFFDGSTIELQAGTQIEVASLDIASDTGSTTIGLKQEIGTTISRVTKLADPESRYEIETRAGIAAVRGSIMLLEVLEDGTTLVTNLEGDIRFTAQGVEIKIPVGRTCIIVPGEPPRLVPLPGDGGGGGEQTTTNNTVTPSIEITAASNDEGTQNDPSEQGAWEIVSENPEWTGNRYDINVAATIVTEGDNENTIIINIGNGYPGYCGSVGFIIKNTGLVPMQVDNVSADMTVPEGGSTDDLSVVITGIPTPGSQHEIAPGDTALGQIYIQVNQSALQGETYTFQVTITFSQST